MTSISVQHLARFLNGLSLLDEPTAVCRLIASTVLSGLGPRGVALHAADGSGSLALIGAAGLEEERHRRSAFLTSDTPVPIAVAFTANEQIHLSVSEMMQRYPITDHPANQGAVQFNPHLNIWCVPVSDVSGQLGVLTAMLEADSTHPDDWLVVEAVSAAVALWMRTHEVASTRSPGGVHAESTATLTKRQTQILELVDEGRTNASIARTLAVSVALVKLDLARAMRLLGTSDRMSTVTRARSLGLLGGESTDIPAG